MPEYSSDDDDLFQRVPITPIFAPAHLTLHNLNHITHLSDGTHPSFEHLFNMPSPALNDYFKEAAHWAERCHADGIRLLAIGGEALVFDLHRHGKPLYAVLRMQPGKPPYLADEIQFEFDEMIDAIQHGEKPSLFIPTDDDHGMAFTAYAHALPAYAEQVITLATDTDHIGMHFRLSPQIATLAQCNRHHYLTQEEIERQIVRLVPDVEKSGVHRGELLAGNVGLYIMANGEHRALYFDPSAIIANHAKLYAFQPNAAHHQLATEIKADGAALFAGDVTAYAQRMADKPFDFDVVPPNKEGFLNKLNDASARGPRGR